MRRFSWAALVGTILAALSLNNSPVSPPADSAPDPEVTWTVVFGKAPPPASRPPGGSRGDSERIYAIAPGQMGRAELWHDQPLFVWQGVIRQIELIAKTGVMWSQAVAAEARSIRYTGNALQPGQPYEWILYNAAKAAIAQSAFRVMNSAERKQIAAELEALTARYTAQFPTASPEQIALQQANYFADRQLWADVLQIALSVADPSDELISLLQQFEMG